MAVTTAVLMVVHRNPVISAISLIGNFFCLAGLYLLLRAQLLAVLQIAVYAGAIMVLVVFVIMLLNSATKKLRQSASDSAPRSEPAWQSDSCSSCCTCLFSPRSPNRCAVTSRRAPASAPWKRWVRRSFHDISFRSQITGMLLLAAVIGAVILAKRVSLREDPCPFHSRTTSA